MPGDDVLSLCGKSICGVFVAHKIHPFYLADVMAVMADVRVVVTENPAVVTLADRFELPPAGAEISRQLRWLHRAHCDEPTHCQSDQAKVAQPYPVRNARQFLEQAGVKR